MKIVRLKIIPAIVRRNLNRRRWRKLTGIHNFTVNGVALEVTLMAGMPFFRRDSSAGWTACSEQLCQAIKEQLK